MNINYPAGVSGAEPYFHDAPEVGAYEVIESLAADAVDGYTLDYSDMARGGVCVGLTRAGERSPSVILSVRADVDSRWLLEALDKADDRQTVIEGQVAVFCNLYMPDVEAPELLHTAIETAIRRIRDHDVREDHPDV